MPGGNNQVDVMNTVWLYEAIINLKEYDDLKDIFDKYNEYEEALEDALGKVSQDTKEKIAKIWEDTFLKITDQALQIHEQKCAATSKSAKILCSEKENQLTIQKIYKLLSSPAANQNLYSFPAIKGLRKAFGATREIQLRRLSKLIIDDFIYQGTFVELAKKPEEVLYDLFKKFSLLFNPDDFIIIIQTLLAEIGKLAVKSLTGNSKYEKIDLRLIENFINQFTKYHSKELYKYNPITATNSFINLYDTVYRNFYLKFSEDEQNTPYRDKILGMLVAQYFLNDKDNKNENYCFNLRIYLGKCEIYENLAAQYSISDIDLFKKSFRLKILLQLIYDLKTNKFEEAIIANGIAEILLLADELEQDELLNILSENLNRNELSQISNEFSSISDLLNERHAKLLNKLNEQIQNITSTHASRNLGTYLKNYIGEEAFRANSPSNLESENPKRISFADENLPDETSSKRNSKRDSSSPPKEENKRFSLKWPSKPAKGTNTSKPRSSHISEIKEPNEESKKAEDSTSSTLLSSLPIKIRSKSTDANDPTEKRNSAIVESLGETANSPPPEKSNQSTWKKLNPLRISFHGKPEADLPSVEKSTIPPNRARSDAKAIPTNPQLTQPVRARSAAVRGGSPTILSAAPEEMSPPTIVASGTQVVTQLSVNAYSFLSNKINEQQENLKSSPDSNDELELHTDHFEPELHEEAQRESPNRTPSF